VTEIPGREAITWVWIFARLQWQQCAGKKENANGENFQKLHNFNR
jgi:hypothetical protein